MIDFLSLQSQVCNHKTDKLWLLVICPDISSTPPDSFVYNEILV